MADGENKDITNVSTDDFVELLKMVSAISSTATKTDILKSMSDINANESRQKRISELLKKYNVG